MPSGLIGDKITRAGGHVNPLAGAITKSYENDKDLKVTKEARIYIYESLHQHETSVQVRTDSIQRLRR